MDLNQLSIVARQRSPWEAIDLGVVVARKWYLPLLLGWAIPSGVCFALFSLLFWDSLWVGIAVTWWLKPLWDRIPLNMASRSLFGEPLDLIATFKSSKHWLLTDAFAWLTWRRLSPTRSFDMPITILEGLRGEERRKRLHTLHINSSGPATFLTIICAHLEVVLQLGVISMVLWLIPEEIEFNINDFLLLNQYSVDLIFYVIAYITMIIVAPFYTMAGFILYISRRIELEAWDIEIRFRHIAIRQQSEANKKDTQFTARKNNRHIIATLLLLPGLFMFSADNVFATQQLTPQQAVTPQNEVQTETTHSPAAKTAREEINTILNGDDFGQDTIKKSWRFKKAEDIAKDEQTPQWFIDFIEFMESYFGNTAENPEQFNFSTFAAQAFEVMLWIAALVAILLVIYHYREHLQSLTKNLGLRKKTADSAPEILFGLDVRNDSIPDNIGDQALSLWLSGSHREALGLLYRATLSRLIHQYQFGFSDSMTEAECAEIVRSSKKLDISNYVSSLTAHWQRLAYGHFDPKDSDIVELCNNWPVLFSIDNQHHEK